MTSPPIRPRALLIDLDGTLADSLSVMRRAYERFLGELDRLPTEAEFAALNGPPLPEIVRRLKRDHQLASSEDGLLARYAQTIDAIYHEVAPVPGADRLLARARAHGCTIGVVTSNSNRRTHGWLAAVGLAATVDFVVSGDDVTRGKPDPEPYRLAAARTGIPHQEIVAVEDSVQGMQAACGAGLRTFVLTGQSGWPPGVTAVNSLDRLSELLWPFDGAEK